MSELTLGSWIPVFPLPLVLLPHERVPLRIFEERYKAMVQRCRETDLPFGVAMEKDEGMMQIACAARIERTLQSYSDGRSDILIRGDERVRITEVREHADGYVEGRVEPAPDGSETVETELAHTLRQLFQEFRRVQAGQGGDPALDTSLEPEEGEWQGETEPGFTYKVAARCPLDLPQRQALLEDVSEVHRAESLVRLLALAIPKIRKLHEDQLHVRGNGRIQSRPDAP